jgi:hypothetical protein
MSLSVLQEDQKETYQMSCSLRCNNILPSPLLPLGHARPLWSQATNVYKLAVIMKEACKNTELLESDVVVALNLVSQNT